MRTRASTTLHTVATTVPAHLMGVFEHTVETFFALARGQQTPEQRVAEIRARDRDAGLDALMTLLEIAECSTAESRIVARFLASLYDGALYPFDLGGLPRIEADVFEHCLTVLRLDRDSTVELHGYIPEGQARWQHMLSARGLSLSPVPEARPIPSHLSARYTTVGNALGYRYVTLFLDLENGPAGTASIEIDLSAADSAELARDLFDVHAFAWRDARRGPHDRQPGEQRPDWLGPA